MSLMDHIEWAQLAVAHTRRILSIGHDNYLPRDSRAERCIAAVTRETQSITNVYPFPQLRSHPNRVVRQIIGRTDSMSLAENAVNRRCGNCSEMSAVAYEFLELMAVYPIDVFEINLMYLWRGQRVPKSHVFVVIGWNGNSPHQPSEWGDEAVVCDPWAKRADQRVFKVSAKLAHQLWVPNIDERTGFASVGPGLGIQNFKFAHQFGSVRVASDTETKSDDGDQPDPAKPSNGKSQQRATPTRQ